MRIPKLCVHQSTGRYYVRLGGEFFYCGAVGGAAEEQAANAKYSELIQEWLANGRTTSPARGEGATINGLAAAYLRSVKPKFDPREYRNVKDAFRPLLFWYGKTPAKDFSAADLEEFRRRAALGGWLTGEALENAEKRGRGKGWCRKSINGHVNRIRRAFRWATRQKPPLVPAAVWAELAAVENLRRGDRETGARDMPDVLPADEPAIAALLECPLTTPLMRDMVNLMLLLGCRPGELCALRWADIDRDGSVARRLLGRAVNLAGCWIYLPGLKIEGGRLSQHHKTAHHGHHRLIPISPAAREILEGYAHVPAGEPIFSSRDGRDQWFALIRKARKTKVQPSQVSRAKPGARRPPKMYTTGAFCQSVRKALERVNELRAAQSPALPPVELFSPNQLRHNAATRLVETVGWDVARLVLGHTTVSTTRRYVLDNIDRALQALGG